MCDNSAVSWSEYESHKRTTESSIRSAIAEELLELLKISEKNNDPECYIQGIKRALDSVLNRTPFLDEQDSPKLF